MSNFWRSVAGHIRDTSVPRPASLATIAVVTDTSRRVPPIAGSSYRPHRSTDSCASKCEQHHSFETWHPGRMPHLVSRAGAELHDSTERRRARAVEKAPEFDRTPLGHLRRPLPL
jgi:hypothetical protein